MVKLKDAVMIGISFLILGIVLSVGIDIFEAVGEETGATTYTDETVNFAANDTYYRTTHTPLSGVSTITNSTPFQLNSDQWATHKTYGVKIYQNDSMGLGNYVVNYSAWTGVAYRTAENATKGASELASWQDTLALVAAAAIILGILFGTFLLRRGAAI